MNTILSLVIILVMAFFHAFRDVPLWACFFVGVGISAVTKMVIEILRELLR